MKSGVPVWRGRDAAGELDGVADQFLGDGHLTDEAGGSAGRRHR
jgi:hypothetical protein